MAEATLMVNEAVWSEMHQGVIQQIDQILTDPRCEAFTLYIPFICFVVKCHEMQEAGKVSTKQLKQEDTSQMEVAIDTQLILNY